MQLFPKKMLHFPPGLLSEGSVKLNILHEGEGFFVIEKPVGVIPDVNPLFNCPSIVEALREQASAGKQDLAFLEGKSLKSVYFLEPEIAGAVVLGFDAEKLNDLRNSYGSEEFSFKFRLVALKNADLPDEVVCDLPITDSLGEGRVRVSHRFGKKTRTVFRKEREVGPYQYWTAEASYLRLHQVRMHAHEVGIRVLGERTYDDLEPLRLADMKRGRVKNSPEEAVYPSVAIVMSHLSFAGADLEVPEPKKFQVLGKYLEKYFAKDG